MADDAQVAIQQLSALASRQPALKGSLQVAQKTEQALRIWVELFKRKLVALKEKNVTVLTNTVARQFTVLDICKRGADEGIKQMTIVNKRFIEENLQDFKDGINNMQILLNLFKKNAKGLEQELNNQLTIVEKKSLGDSDWIVFEASVNREAKAADNITVFPDFTNWMLKFAAFAIAGTAAALIIKEPGIVSFVIIAGAFCTAVKSVWYLGRLTAVIGRSASPS